ncbi:hypothetical protein OEZ86_000671 [Tetradesmus obliquus]|nr:hypothetical protein OEZ86_000671 [Tetradesmus obliquus]
MQPPSDTKRVLRYPLSPIGLCVKRVLSYASHCTPKAAAAAQHSTSVEATVPVQPEYLLGRRVTVKWDSGWFSGKVTAFNANSFKHKVEYDDGDAEELLVGLGVPIKVCIAAGEQLQLPLPSLEQLTQLSQVLLQLAEQAQAEAAKPGGPAKRRQHQKEADDRREQAEELLELADALAEAAAAATVTAGQPSIPWQAKQQALAPKGAAVAAAAPAGSGAAANAAAGPGALPDALTAAQQLLAFGAVHVANVPGLGFTQVEWLWQQLGPSMSVAEAQQLHDDHRRQQQQQQQPSGLGTELFCLEQELSEAYAEHLQNRQQHKSIFKEMDVCLRLAPEALVGRVLRVFWAADDAWFPGGVESYDAATGRHKVKYKDGEEEDLWLGIERVRLMIQPGEQLQPPDAATLRELAQCYAEQAQLLQQQFAKQQGSRSDCMDVDGEHAEDEELSRPVKLQAKAQGCPPWPALVITSEEATDFSIAQGQARLPQVCVQHFGDYTRARVSPASLLPTAVVLEQRLWLDLLARKPSRLVSTYRLSLKELITYCKTGELPDPEMVPEHNDERWLNDDSEDLLLDDQDSSSSTGSKAGKRGAKKGAAQGAAAAADKCYTVNGAALKDLRQWAADLVAQQQQSGDSAPGKAAATGGAKLPLQLAANLQLLSLGRVEFLHPAFHNEKFIWPVGFAVRRRARTPASAGRELWHLAEVLEAPDGSGPLFRITPDGCKPVSGSSPTAAWQELYRAAAGGSISGASAAAAASVCGAKLFGLQHPVVAALVQALPNAAGCDRFMAWQGEPPQPVLLTPELRLAKRAIAARLLRLPPGIQALPLRRQLVGLCDACGEEAEAEDNLMVECDKCRVMVHMRCYGMSKHPDGSSWLCDVCRLPGPASPPPCVLCPRLGGAMKVTAEGGWCHLLCATWIPGMCVADQDTMEPIIGAGRVGKDRRSLLCSICSQPYGACIQCAGSSKCYAAFHPSCARDAGYPMAAVWDEDSSDDEEDAAAPAAGTEQRSSGSKPKNAAAEAAKGKQKGRADRYEAMNASAAARVCSGKSAIHGLGVFAKVPHKAGELVVEYMGHLVRPRVADLLEARTYNQMVGAGTYIFRLNADYCVDATRAGNIAHLINHSCAPCCHSRTITVRCAATGQLRDHVVIVASRDIAAGEEMTYDYRFAGDEKLRCNCGAASCRGWVNAPGSSDSPHKRPDGSAYLPRRELAAVKEKELRGAASGCGAPAAVQRLAF